MINLGITDTCNLMFQDPPSNKPSDHCEITITNVKHELFGLFQYLSMLNIVLQELYTCVRSLVTIDPTTQIVKNG